MRAIIKGDTLTWHFPRPNAPDQVQECRFRIDAAKQPGHFDWWAVNKPSEVHQRLYLLEGNTLKWSANLGTEPRPARFSEGRWQFTCKRD